MDEKNKLWVNRKKIVDRCTLNPLYFYAPPLKKEGHIALHMSVGMSVGRYVGMSVGMSVSLNLVQLITQERFTPEASNLVGR